jgi:hypothetical protein
MSDILQRLSVRSDTISRDAAIEVERLRAENAKLRAFVEDSYCDCEDEYGDEPPYQCERCNLLGQLKGGGDNLTKLEAENATLRLFFEDLSKKHSECTEGALFSPDDLQKAQAVLSLGVLGVLDAETLALAIAAARMKGGER